jgi:hypothetical protein
LRGLLWTAYRHRVSSPDPRAIADRLLEAADAPLAEVLGLHPAVLDQLADRAIALLERKELAEAAQLLEDLSQVDTQSPALPFLLGAARAEQRDHVGALDAYFEAEARAEAAGATATLEAILEARAACWNEVGCREEAKLDLAKASEIARSLG